MLASRLEPTVEVVFKPRRTRVGKGRFLKLIGGYSFFTRRGVSIAHNDLSKSSYIKGYIGTA